MVSAHWIIAAEETEGGVSLLLPATAELIAGIIAFGIVFFFFWRWAVPAINKSLEERQRAIGGQLQEAEKTKAEADALLADLIAEEDAFELPSASQMSASP